MLTTSLTPEMVIMMASSCLKGWSPYESALIIDPGDTHLLTLSCVFPVDQSLEVNIT